MNYEGPEAWKEFITLIYREGISPKLRRDGEPHIIVGGIGKVYHDGKNLRVEAEPEGIKRIDEAFQRWGREGFLACGRTYVNLLSCCKNESMLSNEIIGQYHVNLDVVTLNPQQIVRYIGSEGLDPQQFRKREEAEEYVIAMRFPNRYAHELVHWDSGASQFNETIRMHTAALQPTFDYQLNGKFSDEKMDDLLTERLKVTDAQELLRVLNMITELGIMAFEEVTADLYSNYMILRPFGIKPLNIAPVQRVKLVDKLASLGTGFLDWRREKIDEAYRTERNILSLF
ncbi:hypothetical protein HZB02_00970 [Candidatus Woesearchaeota archaeon]|nr:hypothetical protein [Candidatus Woesearchaeota archaeon]